MEGVLGYDGALALRMLTGHGQTSGGYHLSWGPGEAEFQGQAGKPLRVDLPLDERAPADLSVDSIMLVSSGPECRALQLSRTVSEPRAVFTGRSMMTLLLPLPPPASSE